MSIFGGLKLGDFFSDLFGSGIGGTAISLYGAEQQRLLNERVLSQQEGMFGKGLGMFGFGDIPGVPSVAPPPGMDLSQLPGQAQTLADQLSLQSQGAQGQSLAALGQLGPQGDIMRRLQGLPQQSAIMGQRLLDRFRNRTGTIASQFGEGAQGLRAAFGQGAGALQGQFGAGAAGITGGFEDRLSKAMGMLEGRGSQAEEDIATRFRESLGAQQQSLAARGLGGSTIAGSMAQGSAREESAEQRRLQEQLRGEQLGLFTNLSGQGLAAQERLLGAGTGLGQQLLGAQTGLGQQLLGAGTGLQAGFAGQLLGAGQAGRQFNAGLNLSALGQRGLMGQFSQEQLGSILQQDLGNRFGFGQFGIGTGQQIGGLALGFLGPGQIQAPQQLQYPQILPPVR